ncbi:hypothetical protein [Elioraea tepidiphila]|jgi:nickel/cobalt exporter|uniref:HoxN/HupN/NixA family nickel/cobalt transporter n=1 Tax=Elioraea tepidiphila TaxID=457934 RepID=UPI002FDA98FD
MEGGIFSAVAAGGTAPLLWLPAAFALGALHALEPGHAKSMMAGFVIATRGTPAQGVVLGLAAALSHSLVVWGLVLAAFAVGLDRVPAAWLPWFSLAGGVVVLAVAAWLARGLVAERDHHHAHHHGAGHPHHHDHEHGHAHHHHATPTGRRVGWRAVIAAGFGGGLAPCPGALVVLALALQAGAAALGLAMVAVFSIGLGVVLSGVALAAALSLRLASSAGGEQRFARLAETLPWASVAVMAVAGVYTIGRALLALGQAGG